MLDAISRILAERLAKVEASARLQGPTTSDEGQYVLHISGSQPPREVGLVAYRQSVPVATRPVFWINLEGGAQAALVSTPDGLVREELPSDWIASDYLAAHGDDCSIRFVALNPPRTLIVREPHLGGLVVADSVFLDSHPVTSNLQVRAVFRFVPEHATVEVLSLMVHRTHDRVEAETLLGLLESLLDEPDPDAG